MPRATNEIVTGSVTSTNGVDGNGTFTLAHAPNPASSLALYAAGARRTSGVHFLLSAATITYLPGFNPISGDEHLADYSY